MHGHSVLEIRYLCPATPLQVSMVIKGRNSICIFATCDISWTGLIGLSVSLVRNEEGILINGE